MSLYRGWLGVCSVVFGALGYHLLPDVGVALALVIPFWSAVLGLVVAVETGARVHRIRAGGA